MLKPCGNRIIVVIEDKEETTKGGIIIPHSAQDQNDLIPAKILACGPKVEELSAQDVVLIDEYVGKTVKLDETQVSILDASRVYCIVE